MTKLPDASINTAAAPAPALSGGGEGGPAGQLVPRAAGKARIARGGKGKAGTDKRLPGHEREGGPVPDHGTGLAAAGDSPAGADASAQAGAGAATAVKGSSHLVPYLLGGLAVIGGGAALAGSGGKGNTTATPAAPVPPATPTAALVTDSGTSASDGITNVGTIAVGGLVSGGKWEYSTDAGKTWTAGTGSSFTLPDGSYAANTVQVRQTDSAGTLSSVGQLATAITVDTVIAAPTLDPVAGNNVLTIAEAADAAGVTVTGKAEANARIDLTWRVPNSNQVATGVATADVNGKWSYTFKGAAVPDAHVRQDTTLTVQATDPAGNVSSLVTRTVTTDPGVTVQGTITAGTVVAGNDLTVSLYSGTGKLLAAGIKVGADGSFSVANVPLVQGDVVIATVANGSQPDHLDEATGTVLNLSARLIAAVTIGDPAVALNINPLTTLAAQSLGLGSDANGALTGTAGAAAIAAANLAVAKAFGLAVGDLPSLKPEVIPAGGFAAGATLSAAQQAGLVLAALSALDQQNGGNAQATIDQLTKALGQGGATGLGEAGQKALLNAAAQASGKLGVGLVSQLASQLAQGSSTGQVAIDRVAGDDVINAAESKVLTLTGTVAAGATAVSLQLGNSAVTAVVDGTTWSYALGPADLAALGSDGPLVVRATATLADGSSATAQRTVLLETTLPTGLSIDPVRQTDLVGGDLRGGVVVSGHAAPWATVSVQWAGGPHTVAADQNGAWQWRFDPAELPSADGKSAIVASVVDRYGNPGAGAVSHAVTVDRAAPAKPAIDPVGKYGLVSPTAIAAGVTVSGTGEAGATVSVGWDAQHRQTVTVGSDGKWRASFAAGQLPGTPSVAFNASQTDAAGNTGPVKQGDPVLLVRSAAGPVIGPVAGGDGINNAEAGANVVIAGVAAPGTSLILAWDNSDPKLTDPNIQTVTADDQGYWAFTYGVNILPPDGQHTLTVVGTDAAGVALPPASLDILIDTTAPLAPGIDKITDDDRVNQGEKAAGVTITGTAPEAGVQVWVTWGGKTHKVDVDPQSLTWQTKFLSSEIPPDATGSKVTAVAVDSVGNASLPTDRVVDIITTPPPAPTVALLEDTGNAAGGGSASDGKSKNGTLKITGLVAKGTWEYSTNGGADWVSQNVPDPNSDGVIVATISLDDGAYVPGAIRVRQTDVAGNKSVEGTTPALIISSTAPGVDQITAAGDNIVNAQEQSHGVDIQFSVSGIVKDVPATIQVAWSAGSGAAKTPIGQPKTVVVTANGTYTVHFDSGEIPAGQLATQVTITGTDAVGNAIETQTQDVVIQTVAPNQPSLALDRDTGADPADGITNDPTIQVGALATDPSTLWQYSTNGGVSWTDGAGTTFDLAAGFYAVDQVQVRQKDAAGNFSKVTTNRSAITIDLSTDEPTINPIGTGGVINAAAKAQGVTLSGTAEVGAIVKVVVNGITYSDVVANPSLRATADATGKGRWSLFLSAAQLPADGQGYNVTVTAVDVAGNASNPDGVQDTFTVDTARPDAPTIDRLQHGYAITAENRASGVTFTGTTVVGTQVKVLFNGAESQATVAADGTWTATFLPGQIPADAAGATVSAIATSIHGNPSLAREQGLVIDSTVAAPSINSLKDNLAGLAAKQQGLSFSGQAEAYAIVTLKLGVYTVTATADGDGNWQGKFAGWQLPLDGAQTLRASAQDRYGNVSGETSYGFTLDTAAPNALSITSVGDTDLVVSDTTVTVSGRDTPGSLVTLTWGSTTVATVKVDAQGRWSAPLTVPVQQADSTVTLTASVTDAAGNAGPTVSREVPVVGKAHTGPVIAPVGGDGYVNAAELASGIRIIGYAAPGAVVNVTGLPSSYSPTPNDVTGLWTVSVPKSALADGTYTVTATQNNLPVTRTFTVDTKAPEGSGLAAVTDITSYGAGAHDKDLTVSAAEKQSDRILVVGTSEANASVRVTWTGLGHTGVDRFVKADSNGNWSAEYKAGELPLNGDSTITLVTTDQAGNVGQTTSFTAHVDTALFASETNHTLYGIGNGDELYGTTGDDTFVIPDLNFVKIDGRGGNDVLQLGSGITHQTLDLTQLLSGQLKSIARIDLGANAGNHLVVNAAAILTEGTGPNSAGQTELFVTGSGDRVTAFGFTDAKTTQTADGHTYALYTSGTAKLWVEQSVTMPVVL